MTRNLVAYLDSDFRQNDNEKLGLFLLSAKQLETYITTNLACDFIEVRGDDGTHFEATIVSPAFEGKRMVQQHQLVYAALGDRMRAEIHALSMQTFTPQQWANKN